MQPQDNSSLPTGSPDNQADMSKTPSGQPTRRSYLFLALLLLIVIVAVAAIVGFNKKPKTNTASLGFASVNITSSGFVPATLNIKADTQVTWTNSDTKPHEVAANPYPLDNSIPGFLSKDILQSKDTLSFTFEKAGKYSYHDQLNPLSPVFQGIVIVK